VTLQSLERYSTHEEDVNHVAADRRPTRRVQQATQTRSDIVAAARRLFATRGYAKTSMARIAAEAGVSVQTIYDSLGSKRAIVLALNDLIDTEGDVSTLAARIPGATDHHELLDIAVGISRNINERCADILRVIYDSAALEPEMKQVRDESRRRHRTGIAGIAGRLAALGALRPDLGAVAAADVIAALTDPNVARTFAEEYGWSWDRWHTWTVAALATLVLAPTGQVGG